MLNPVAHQHIVLFNTALSCNNRRFTLEAIIFHPILNDTAYIILHKGIGKRIFGFQTIRNIKRPTFVQFFFNFNFS